MNALVRYEQARAALAECARIDEASDIRDKAAALAAYARQRDDRDLEVWVREIQLRACVRIGELSRELDQAKTLRVPGGATVRLPTGPAMAKTATRMPAQFAPSSCRCGRPRPNNVSSRSTGNGSGFHPAMSSWNSHQTPSHPTRSARPANTCCSTAPTASGAAAFWCVWLKSEEETCNEPIQRIARPAANCGDFAAVRRSRAPSWMRSTVWQSSG